MVSLNTTHLALFCTQEAKANVVVAIVRGVVVAIRRSGVLRVVVPRPPALHAIPADFVRQPNGSEGVNSDCCSLLLLACCMYAVLLCTDAVSFSMFILPH